MNVPERLFRKNILGQVIYNEVECFYRQPVVELLLSLLATEPSPSFLG